MRDSAPHILVVDDDPSIREALATAFKGTYVVHAAATGAEACALLRRHPLAAIEVAGPYVRMVEYADEGLQVTISSGPAVDPELWRLVRRTVEQVFGRPDSVVLAHGGPSSWST